MKNYWILLFILRLSTTFAQKQEVDLKVRIKAQNMPTKVAIAEMATTTSHRWEVRNLTAVELEPYSIARNRQMPMVYTAPTDFAVDDYNGTIKSWGDLGTFYHQLNSNRTALPTDFSAKIKALVANEKTDVARIKKLYEYLQNNTRYVSIQLGIGGWQTMTATDAATKGFGDCKALTNLMGAMLTDIGIKSYPVLVRAGEDEADILYDFPSFQFNHVFVCVPNNKDTLWLECTSQTNPMGYLGTFTGNRHVLLITEKESKLLKTPSLTPTDNAQLRKSLIVLKENGEAKASVKTMYKGEQQEKFAAVLHHMTASDQRKWLEGDLDLPSVEIEKYGWVEQRDRVPM